MTPKIFTTIALDKLKQHLIKQGQQWNYAIKEYDSNTSPIIPHIVEIWAGEDAEYCVLRITGNKESVWDDVLTTLTAIGVEKLFLKLPKL